MDQYKPSFAFIEHLSKKYNFIPSKEYENYLADNKDNIIEKSFDFYVNELSKILNIDIDNLLKGGRKREYVLPRHLLRHILYSNGVGSLLEVARLTGCRGHDGVIHSIKMSNDLIQIKDKHYMRYYKPLAHLLNDK